MSDQKFVAPKPEWHEPDIETLDKEPLRETYNKICDIMEKMIKDGIK